MRTSEELTEELHRRMKARRKAKARRNRIIGASAVVACLVVAIGFATFVSQNPVNAPNAVSGAFTASIFAEHATLGCVVVALVSFCLGVVVTVLCHRLKQRSDDEEKHDDRTH